jgi:hypothetical protein
MALAGDLNSREYEKFADIASGTSAVRVVMAQSLSMNTAYATINIGSAKTAGTATSAISGLIYKVSQAVGTLSGTPGTVDTKLLDATGGTIAVLAAQEESSTATYATTVPITTSMKWITEATGDPDGTQVAAAGVNVVLNITYQS